MKLPRRTFLHLAAGAAALPAISRIAWAQSYPTRPITLVVPVAAGGAVDSAARIIAEKLHGKLRQPVVVENRTGAGPVVGTNFVAKSAPDGYTLLLLPMGSLLAKWLNKNLPFDVINDLTPIAMVGATTPVMLFAHPSVTFRDVKELITYSRVVPQQALGRDAGHRLAAAPRNGMVEYGSED